MRSDEPQAPSPSSAKRALRALQEMQAKLSELESQARAPIAIVGMSCRYPGAEDLRAYWEMLCTGRDAISEVPRERWDINEFFDPDSRVPGKIMTRWGGFLSNLEKFDAEFFGISPREAPHVDPRQRLMLEIVWQALEDAGIPPDTLAGTDTGVYLGVLTNDYDQLISQDLSRFQVYTGIGTANSIVANRVSYFFDLRGPSLVVDTACSGSLLAIDLACRSLRSGETTLALAGGVAVNLQPNGDVFFSRAGSLSTEGRCRTFDSSANGMVRSEGAGVIVLKPLSRALADGNRIYAVIRGSAVNHDGRSNGIMSPNGLAQEAMLRLAYRNAGVSPGQVQYIEAHGTGTRVGDPVEVKALSAVLATDRPAGFTCALGSVKTNIGHTESASGVAGVIKVALALAHRTIPPHLHLKELNPLIPAAEFPIRIYDEAGAWPDDSRPLIAGVSSFSFGGTNVHLVLEEAPQLQEQATPAIEDGPWILPLSARSGPALQGLAEGYRALLDGGNERQVSLRDTCFTAAVRRSHHEDRLAVIGRTGADVARSLSHWLEGGSPEELITGRRSRERGPRIVFVFSGQGSHWLGMGRELYRTEAVFRNVIDRCDVLLSEYADWSLIAEMNATPEHSRLAEIDVAQPAIFSFQVALASLWRAWGVEPQAVVGQSLGEVAAAHVSGALTLEDAVRVVFHRSRLLRTTAGKGRTAVVGLAIEQAYLALAGYEDKVSVAGSSGPTSSLISGNPETVGLILDRLETRGIFCRSLDNVDTAAHSPQMEPLKSELRAVLEDIAPQATSVALHSTVTGGAIDGTDMDANYWARNLREPFLFANVVQDLIENGHDIFIEISSHPVLTGAIKQSFAHLSRDGEAIGSLNREEPERYSLKRAVASLYASGYDFDWSLQFASPASFVEAPGYVWQRERYWYKDLKGTGRPGTGADGDDRRPLLGKRFFSAASPGVVLWQNELNAHSLYYLRDHRIGDVVVFPGAGFLEIAASALREQFGNGALMVENASFERLLLLSEGEIRTIQTLLTPTAAGTFDFRVYGSTASATPNTAATDWTLHATGIARKAPSHEDALRIDLARLRSECPNVASIDDHYLAMKLRGLNYGTSFQCLRHLQRGERRALGLIKFDRPSELPAYQVHPAMLDAGIQVISATLPSVAGDTYLPQGVDRLTIYEQFPAIVWCHAALADGQKAGANELLSNLTFFDESGRVLAEVEGMRLRRMEIAAPAARPDARQSIYDVIWREQPIQDAVRVTARGRWLVLADRAGIGAVVASQLQARGEQVIVLGSADEMGTSPISRLEEIVANEVAANGPGLAGVIHLWGIDAPDFSKAGPDGRLNALAEAQELGPLAGLSVIRALTQHDARVSTRLWMVTRGAHEVCGSRTAVLQRGVWGLGRALAVEHPELWGGLVDLDENGGIEAAASQILREVTSGDSEQEVAWRGDARFVPRLTHWQERDGLAVQCRADSTYLVTGGLSGLGLEAAKWLISRGARRLIIAGRTPLPERAGWQSLTTTSADGQRVAALKDLERMGASIDYWAVNVADVDAMRANWLREQAEGRPEVRGIIHAAGVIDDVLAMRMSREHFTAVHEGKVQGAFVLEELSEGLDFFISYTSITGVLGQIGQGNYGAANGYLDALMEYRRQQGRPGMSVAWGPWAEVGIYARGKEAGRTSLFGVTEIDAQQGEEALSLAATTNGSNVVVVNADWRHARPTQMISQLNTETVSNSVSDEGGEESTLLLDLIVAEPAERRSLLESYLRETVARVLKFEPSRLSLTKPLTAMGLDSIMAVEMKNVIQATLSLTVTMVDLFTGSITNLVERLESQLADDGRLTELLAEVEELPDAQ